MNRVKNQYHINNQENFFESTIQHPLSTYSQTELQQLIKNNLSGNFRLRKSGDKKNLLLGLAGETNFADVHINTTDAGGTKLKRKLRVPFYSKPFLKKLLSQNDRDFLIIMPYSDVVVEENGNLLLVENLVFLIMTCQNILDCSIGNEVNYTHLDF